MNKKLANTTCMLLIEEQILRSINVNCDFNRNRFHVIERKNNNEKQICSAFKSEVRFS